MDTRENLLRRDDVRDRDIDDILAIARELQERDRGDDEASEYVDASDYIDDACVERAIRELARRRATGELDRQRQQARSDEARAARLRMIGLAGVVGLVLLLGVVLGGLWMASTGVADLTVAQSELDRASDAITEAIDDRRSQVPKVTSLHPQVDARALQALDRQVGDAVTVPDRAAASDALAQALRREIAALPPLPDDLADRKDRVLEILARSDRVLEQELRRHEAAELGVEAVRDTVAGTLATWTGLAP